MPSPVGHALAGICGYMVARKHIAPPRRGWLLVGSLVITSLADFDVFPGLLVGDPRIFHHQASHSLAVALLFGLLMGGLANLWKLNGIGWGIWGGGLYLSHLVLDLLVNDATPPFGIQLLWPISDAYFVLPITPFDGFQYYDPAIGMARTMLSVDNLRSMLQEIVLMAPFVGLAWYYGNYCGRRLLKSGPDRPLELTGAIEAPRHIDCVRQSTGENDLS